MPMKVFPGNYNNLAEIGKFVTIQSEIAGLNENDAYAVQLAIDEACTNIIEHGYGGENKGSIECTCKTSEEGIEIILVDEGKLFNPKTAPMPKLKVPLEELASRGAGVYLMHKVMDEIKYNVDENNHNKLILKKNK